MATILQEHLFDQDSRTRSSILAARLRRRQAHSVAASLRQIDHSPALQSVRAAASRKARVTNIAAAIMLGKSVEDIETQPISNRKRNDYFLRIRNLDDEVRSMLNSFKRAA